MICMAFPDVFAALANEVTEMIASGELEASSWFADANNLMIVAGGIGGVIMWEILHSVFVRPFILVGVLRNFIESGKKTEFSEKDYSELDGKSRKFKKLHEEIA